LSTKPVRRGLYNAGRHPRVGLRQTPTIWRGIRQESTDTGEDRSGHIAAGTNEGILFFDSNDPNKVLFMTEWF
jgi:hypothetical protein